MVLGFVVTVLAGVAGCATLTKTPEEDWALQERIWDIESREIAEDYNMMMLSDRPSRLTRWSIR
jgi:hypothetical protein